MSESRAWNWPFGFEKFSKAKKMTPDINHGDKILGCNPHQIFDVDDNAKRARNYEAAACLVQRACFYGTTICSLSEVSSQISVKFILVSWGTMNCNLFQISHFVGNRLSDHLMGFWIDGGALEKLFGCHK